MAIFYPDHLFYLVSSGKFYPRPTQGFLLDKPPKRLTYRMILLGFFTQMPQEGYNLPLK